MPLVPWSPWSPWSPYRGSWCISLPPGIQHLSLSSGSNISRPFAKTSRLQKRHVQSWGIPAMECPADWLRTPRITKFFDFVEVKIIETSILTHKLPINICSDLLFSMFSWVSTSLFFRPRNSALDDLDTLARVLKPLRGASNLRTVQKHGNRLTGQTRRPATVDMFFLFILKMTCWKPSVSYMHLESIILYCVGQFKMKNSLWCRQSDHYFKPRREKLEMLIDLKKSHAQTA